VKAELAAEKIEVDSFQGGASLVPNEILIAAGRSSEAK
jgi:hypothetical protein